MGLANMDDNSEVHVNQMFVFVTYFSHCCNKYLRKLQKLSFSSKKDGTVPHGKKVRWHKGDKAGHICGLKYIKWPHTGKKQR